MVTIRIDTILEMFVIYILYIYLNIRRAISLKEMSLLLSI